MVTEGLHDTVPLDEGVLLAASAEFDAVADAAPLLTVSNDLLRVRRERDVEDEPVRDCTRDAELVTECNVLLPDTDTEVLTDDDIVITRVERVEECDIFDCDTVVLAVHDTELELEVVERRVMDSETDAVAVTLADFVVDAAGLDPLLVCDATFEAVDERLGIEREMLSDTVAVALYAPEDDGLRVEQVWWCVMESVTLNPPPEGLAVTEAPKLLLDEDILQVPGAWDAESELLRIGCDALRVIVLPLFDRDARLSVQDVEEDALHEAVMSDEGSKEQLVLPLGSLDDETLELRSSLLLFVC
jgi:hypothetical protein